MLDGSGGGMGEVLAGADLRIRELAVPIRRFASESVVDAAVLLAVLPAGIRPPDPSGALGSPAAAALLSRLAGEYRHVIVVGPSSQWQTESTTVSKLTDATLMVVGGTLSVDQTREIKAAYEAEPGRFLAIAVVEARRS